MHTKYAISYICFLLVCNISLSQEKNSFDFWLNEYTLDYERYEKGDFTNAIPHFTNALNVSDQIDFSTNSETEYYPINNQNYLGVCYFRLEQFRHAATHFEGTLKQVDTIRITNDTYYNQVLDNLINSYTNLDLSNTDLVVLSACETGLGDVDNSEGVYGLQRAFKMAGVDIIIMSLWEVPDAETSEFMTTFYTNWLSGQKIRTAFRNTQLTMAETYKDNPEK